MGASPIGRYFGLMMDRMVGKDYERGLAKLKTVVEQLPNVDIAGFTAEAVQLEARTIAFVTKTTTMDVPAISKAYEDAYSEIGKFMAANKLKQNGAPLGIDGPMQANSYTFDAGMPIDRSDVSGAGSVGVKQTAAGPALKYVHVGPYENLSDTLAKLAAFAAAHHYSPAGGVLSIYVDDPASVAADQLKTEIYLPVK
jgi:effector-binding domain-containing protein